MNWVDAAIIAIVLIFVIVGCVKGLVFSVLSIFSSSVNFFISLFLTRPVASLINALFGMESSLTSNFAAKLTAMDCGFDVELSTFGSQAELSSHVSETINNSSLSGFSKGILNSTVHITPENVAGTNTTLNDIVSKSFASFLTLVISFIIVFILIYLILWIISAISKKMHKNQDVRLTDRILGLFFGLIKGFLFVVLVFGVLSFFNENGVLAPIIDYIKSSTIGGWLYGNVSTFVHKYIDLKEIFKGIIDRA